MAATTYKLHPGDKPQQVLYNFNMTNYSNLLMFMGQTYMIEGLYDDSYSPTGSASPRTPSSQPSLTSTSP